MTVGQGLQVLGSAAGPGAPRHRAAGAVLGGHLLAGLVMPSEGQSSQPGSGAFRSRSLNTSIQPSWVLPNL